jgi:DNA (cytosine-5)-methyltransferase 1
MTKTISFIDLFCGIGGFRQAIQNAAGETGFSAECAFSSDIDEKCKDVYEANFGERPSGDISKVDEKEIPDHNILLAGFPCQPFSIIGQRKGFEDTRGTLFFEIARILKEKKPDAFVLENVKLLTGHNKGRTIKVIMETLKELGYHAEYRVLNALDFGLPQKRERVFIIGSKEKIKFKWPEGNIPMTPLSEILEEEPSEKMFASEHIRKKRHCKKQTTKEPAIWHENKSGNISVYPYSCALRAGASHNYLLVNGERRLTPREMLRLQGFPDDFQPPKAYTQVKKQAGNSLPVPVAQAVIKEVLKAIKWGDPL